jgi:TonB family protein
MNTRRLAVTILASLVLLQPSTSTAQDTLSQARTLYASADYEQALKLLENVPAAREVHYYRALCLIALARPEAAEEEIRAVVALDPLFVPPAGEVSPRVTATFAAARQRLLPELARKTFAEARRKYQGGDRDGARTDFELTLKILDDSGLDEGDDLADLRLVASGFLDLATLKAAPEPPPAPEPALAPATAAASAVVAPPAVPTATLPITVTQDLPAWRPDSSMGRRTFSGAVRVEIDATGRVTGAFMERPVYPSYDRLVLAAARKWTYQPATLNGVPIPSEKTVEIELRP